MNSKSQNLLVWVAYAICAACVLIAMYGIIGCTTITIQTGAADKAEASPTVETESTLDLDTPQKKNPEIKK